MIIRSTLKEQAYKLLKQAIIDGLLTMDTLYSEQWFADYLKVSRTPVREALLQMQEESVIKVLPNRGIMINPISEQEIRNIMQMRSAIESFSSAYLASRIDTISGLQVIMRLEQNISDERYSTHDECDLKKHLLLHMQFHMDIINFTENPYFIKSFDNMRFRITQFAVELFNKTDRIQSAISEHRVILNAIKSGDENESYQAMIEHLEATKTNLLKQILIL